MSRIAATWWVAVLVSALVVGAGCTFAPTEPSTSPVRSVEPSPPPASAEPVVSAPTPNPSTPTPPTPPPPVATPSPMPTLPPDASALKAVYAALRPANLRTVEGTTVVYRRAAVQFVYEIENSTDRAVTVQPGVAQGVEQTWLERLGLDPEIPGCLPRAGRKGSWYATGGRLISFFGPPDLPIEPGRGLSRWLVLGPDITACLPAGQYRVHVEYKATDATDLDDVLATASIDLELREPALAALLSGPVITGAATLEISAEGTRGSSVVRLDTLPAGAIVRSEIVAAPCGSDGPVVAVPPEFAADFGGTYRQRWQLTIRDAVVRGALAAGGPISIRVAVNDATSCAAYAPEATASGQALPPTALPGAILQVDTRDGRVVSASSETPAGPPDGAIDGRIDFTWNAGRHPPAWVEIDFGRDVPITTIRLLPSQSPSPAPTVHRILGRGNGAMVETLLVELTGSTEDNRWIEAPLEAVARVRYVRVETVASPSWVAWREIDVVVEGAVPRTRAPEGWHDGSVDAIAGGDRCYANGWASDPDDRAADVTVRILADGSEIWQGVANMLRTDVKSAGYGDGTSGFWVVLGKLVTPGEPHEIRVQARDGQAGPWTDLHGTPRTITCRP